MGDYTHKDSFNTHLAFVVAIPQTQDLTDTRVIKHDFSRKTNIEDNYCRQLALLACVVFNDEKEEGGCKNIDEIMAKKTVETL